MPVETSCTNCGKKFKVRDEVIGKKVRCSGCKQPFVAEAPLEVAEAPVNYDIPDEPVVDQAAPPPSVRKVKSSASRAKPILTNRPSQKFSSGDSGGGGTGVAMRIGVGFTILGAGGLILPSMGRQFTLFSNLPPENQAVAAAIFLVIGIVCLIIGISNR